MLPFQLLHSLCNVDIIHIIFYCRAYTETDLTQAAAMIVIDNESDMKRACLPLFQREGVIVAGRLWIMFQNIGLRNAYQAIAPAIFFGVIAVGQQPEDRVVKGGKINRLIPSDGLLSRSASIWSSVTCIHLAVVCHFYFTMNRFISARTTDQTIALTLYKFGWF